MDPLFEKVINQTTNAESIVRDRLEALDQWMRDPIQDPLSEIARFFEPRKPSTGVPSMTGDAMMVSDPDWSETAAFVERVLRFLYPDRRDLMDIAGDERSLELELRAERSGRRTEDQQIHDIDERASAKVATLRRVVDHLESGGSSVPAWLNPDSLEKRIKSEARDEARKVREEKTKHQKEESEEAVRETEQVREGSSEADKKDALPTQSCAGGGLDLEEHVQNRREHEQRTDAQAQGKGPIPLIKEQQEEREEREKNVRNTGGSCGAGASCEPTPCACPATTTKTEEQVKTALSNNKYTVKAGDSLSKIAQTHLGDMGRWPEIYELNKDTIGGNPDLIYPDQVFVLPLPNVEVVEQDVAADKPDTPDACACEDAPKNAEEPEQQDPAVTEAVTETVSETSTPPAPPTTADVAPAQDTPPPVTEQPSEATEAVSTGPVEAVTPEPETTTVETEAAAAETAVVPTEEPVITPPEPVVVIERIVVAEEPLSLSTAPAAATAAPPAVEDSDPWMGESIALMSTAMESRTDAEVAAAEVEGLWSYLQSAQENAEQATAQTAESLLSDVVDNINTTRAAEETYGAQANRAITDDQNFDAWTGQAQPLITQTLDSIPPQEVINTLPIDEQIKWMTLKGTWETIGGVVENNKATLEGFANGRHTSAEASSAAKEDIRTKAAALHAEDQPTVDRLQNPISAEATTDTAPDDAVQEEPPESPQQTLPDVSYPEMDAFVDKLTTARLAMVSEHEVVLGYGSKDASETLHEDLEVRQAGLKDEETDVLATFHTAHDARMDALTQKEEDLESEATDPTPTDPEAPPQTTLQEVRDALHEEDVREQTYTQHLGFEFSQIDAIMSAVKSGEPVNGALTATFAVMDFSDRSFGEWKQAFVSTLQAFYQSSMAEYDKVRGYGSQVALDDLKEETEAKLIPLQQEQTAAMAAYSPKNNNTRAISDEEDDDMLSMSLSAEERQLEEEQNLAQLEIDAIMGDIDILTAGMLDGMPIESTVRPSMDDLRNSIAGLLQGGKTHTDWAEEQQTQLTALYARVEKEKDVAQKNGASTQDLTLLAQSLERDINRYSHVFSACQILFLSDVAQSREAFEAGHDAAYVRSLSAEDAIAHQAKLQAFQDTEEDIERVVDELDLGLQPLRNLQQSITSGEPVEENPNVDVVDIASIDDLETWAKGLIASHEELFNEAKPQLQRALSAGSKEALENTSKPLSQRHKALETQKDKTFERYQKRLSRQNAQTLRQATPQQQKELRKQMNVESLRIKEAEKLWKDEINHASGRVQKLLQAAADGRSLEISAEKDDIVGALERTYDTVTESDVLDWRGTFIQRVEQTVSAMRQEYMRMLGSGDSNAAQEYSRGLQEVTGDLQSESNQTINFFQKMLGKSEEDSSESEGSSILKKVDPAHARLIRQSQDLIADALQALTDIETLEGQQADTAIASVDVLAEGFNIVDWTNSLVKEVKGYREEQQQRYKNKVWPSGSKDACVLHGRDIKRNRDIFQKSMARTERANTEENLQDLDLQARQAANTALAPSKARLEAELKQLDVLAAVASAGEAPRRILQQADQASGSGQSSEAPASTRYLNVASPTGNGASTPTGDELAQARSMADADAVTRLRRLNGGDLRTTPTLSNVKSKGEPADETTRLRWNLALPTLDDLAGSLSNPQTPVESLQASAKQAQRRHGLKSASIIEQTGRRTLRAHLNPRVEQTVRIHYADAPQMLDVSNASQMAPPSNAEHRNAMDSASKRSADSPGQTVASSLLSTLNTLPSTTSDYNDIHQKSSNKYPGIHKVQFSADKQHGFVNDSQGKGGNKSEYNDKMGFLGGGVAEMMDGSTTALGQGLNARSLLSKRRENQQELATLKTLLQTQRQEATALQNQLKDKPEDSDIALTFDIRKNDIPAKLLHLQVQIQEIENRIEALESSNSGLGFQLGQSAIEGVNGLTKVAKGVALDQAKARDNQALWTHLTQNNENRTGIDQRSGYGTKGQSKNVVIKNKLGASDLYKNAKAGRIADKLGGVSDGLTSVTGMLSAGKSIYNIANMDTDADVDTTDTATAVSKELTSGAKDASSSANYLLKTVKAAGATGLKSHIAGAAKSSAILGIALGVIDTIRGGKALSDAAAIVTHYRQLKPIRKRVERDEEASPQHKQAVLAEIDKTLADPSIQMLVQMQSANRETAMLDMAGGILSVGSGIAMLCPIGAPVAIGLAVAGGLLKLGSFAVDYARNRKARSLFDIAKNRLDDQGNKRESDNTDSQPLSPLKASQRIESAYYNKQAEIIENGSDKLDIDGTPKEKEKLVRWSIQGKYDLLGEPDPERNMAEADTPFPNRTEWVTINAGKKIHRESDLPSYRDWNELNARKASDFVNAGRAEVAEKVNDLAYNTFAGGASLSMKGDKPKLTFDPQQTGAVDLSEEAKKVLENAAQDPSPINLLTLVKLDAKKYEKYLNKAFTKAAKKIKTKQPNLRSIELQALLQPESIKRMTQPLADKHAKKS